MTDSKTILCVDDDPDILLYLETVLTREGFDFAAAGSAEEALTVYREKTPDLLIVDLMMEEVDAGTGLVEKLRLLGNRAPVFMLSSVGDHLSATADYNALGLAGVFQKPLSKDHLLAVIRAKLTSSPVATR